jgi:single-stranded-DNA-specific exonuclease
VEPSQLDAFRGALQDYLADHFPQSSAPSELRIDAEVPFSALTLAAVQQIERLAPFGQANPRPLLCSSGIELAAPPRTIGGGDRHLALQLSHYGVRLRGVAFGGGEWASQLSDIGGPLSFAYRPVINTFRGRRSVEIHIDDWQPDEALSGTASVAIPASSS